MLVTNCLLGLRRRGQAVMGTGMMHKSPAGNSAAVWGRAGNSKSMLVTNCLFRLGGVAALLSNRPCDARAAKYRLDHVVRTHLGADPVAYKCAPCVGSRVEVLGVRAARVAWTLHSACGQGTQHVAWTPWIRF